MTNIEAKQEAIKKAYSEHWDKVKDYVDENGWASYPNVQKHDYDFGKLEFKDGCTFLRPESLKGIENNNGWIKIESEKDLPKDNKDYWVMTNMKEDSIQQLSNLISIRCLNLVKNIKVTHYQQIEKPKPPIY